MSKKFLSLVMVVGAMILVFSNSFQTKAISVRDGIETMELGGRIFPNLSGVYRICGMLDGNKFVDVDGASTADGANVQLLLTNPTDAQKFNFEMQDDGSYLITAMCSGKMLDVKDSGQSAGTNVQQSHPDGSDAQSWTIFSDDGNGYFLMSKCNGFCLDVEKSHTEDVANISCWPWKDSPSQKFRFVR